MAMNEGNFDYLLSQHKDTWMIGDDGKPTSVQDYITSFKTASVSTVRIPAPEEEECIFLNPDASDVVGTQTSFTKNGFTVEAIGPDDQDLTFLDQGDGDGVGIDSGRGSDKLFEKGEGMRVTREEGVETLTSIIGELGQNNFVEGQGVRYIIHLANGESVIEDTEIDIERIQNGLFATTFNAADYNSAILGFDILADTGGLYRRASVLLNDVKVTPLPEKPTPLVLGEELRVDETALRKEGSPIVKTGIIDIEGDRTGDITLNGDFSIDGSLTNGVLSHDGQSIQVTQVNENKLVGRTEDGEKIFMFKVNKDGNYVFKQFENIDHADGKNPNDIGNLIIGISALDGNHETVDGDVNISIADDVHKMRDDEFTVKEGRDGVKGDISKNDRPSADGEDITYTKINGEFILEEGTTYEGEYGHITIFQDGKIHYELNEDAPFNTPLTENFRIKGLDGDGDKKVSHITINAINVPDPEPTPNPEFNDNAATFWGFSVKGEANLFDNDENLGEGTRVEFVKFGGKTYDVPENGNTTIDTGFGTAKVFSNGTIKYNLDKANVTNGAEFEFGITDDSGRSFIQEGTLTQLQYVDNAAMGVDINGTNLADVLSTTNDADLVFGRDGDDWIVGWATSSNDIQNDVADELHGNAGDDVLVGGMDEDRLFGGSGDDFLSGGFQLPATFVEVSSDTPNTPVGSIEIGTVRDYGGHDWLDGGSGDDVIKGGKGRDTLIGGNDNDRLTGGEDPDQFVFYDNAKGDTDTITDLNNGGDLDSILIEIAEGMNLADAFVLETQGQHTLINYGDDNTIRVLNTEADDVRAAITVTSDINFDLG